MNFIEFSILSEESKVTLDSGNFGEKELGRKVEKTK